MLCFTEKSDKYLQIVNRLMATVGSDRRYKAGDVISHGDLVRWVLACAVVLDKKGLIMGEREFNVLSELEALDFDDFKL